MATRMSIYNISAAERRQLETELGVELIPGTEVMTEYVCQFIPYDYLCSPMLPGSETTNLPKHVGKMVRS